MGPLQAQLHQTPSSDEKPTGSVLAHHTLHLICFVTFFFIASLLGHKCLGNLVSFLIAVYLFWHIVQGTQASLAGKA